MTTFADHDVDVVRTTFRQAMGNVAAPVSVVTTLTDARPHGTTVSAFVSLSMDPPLLLASLDHRSDLLAALDIGSRVGVNVLAADQGQVALRFAGKGPDSFAGLAWSLEDGAPALAERHAWVSMTVEQLVAAGDHTLVIGGVTAASTRTNAPLVYWQQTFGSHHAV